MSASIVGAAVTVNAPPSTTPLEYLEVSDDFFFCHKVPTIGTSPL
ncbi:MAG: hypothetical protein R2720_12855 [Candidatus Nanopelagicales bacterium]